LWKSGKLAGYHMPTLELNGSTLFLASCKGESNAEDQSTLRVVLVSMNMKAHWQQVQGQGQGQGTKLGNQNCNVPLPTIMSNGALVSAAPSVLAQRTKAPTETQTTTPVMQNL
jgi:hypothetical protein